jgi:N-dimethylarginine dimethylaminohydrolase
LKRTLSIQNETGLLKAVILGIGEDQGGELDINPVSKWHKENGTYPTQEAIIQEIQTVEKALIHAGVEVLRPSNLPRIEQIFTRDIGFVIEDRFVIANMLEPVRQPEIRGIEWIIDQIDPSQIIKLPSDARVEGGDVIVYNEHVFVGISKRTNRAGFEYLQSQFPDKNFHPIELLVTDDHTTNILHLDCTFQPVGQDMAILYEDGFHNRPEVIYSLFSQEKLIKVTQQEMNQMFPNIFSISPNQVLIEKSFKRLSKELKSRGIEPIEVSYSETSKLSGLLRCSTLPLYRL